VASAARSGTVRRLSRQFAVAATQASTPVPSTTPSVSDTAPNSPNSRRKGEVEPSRSRNARIDVAAQAVAGRAIAFSADHVASRGVDPSPSAPTAAARWMGKSTQSPTSADAKARVRECSGQPVQPNTPMPAATARPAGTTIQIGART
jgi:hypothetical protein